MRIRTIVLSSLLVSAALLAGCASSPSHGEEGRESTSASSIGRGQYLYGRRCGLCHAAHDPKRFSDEEWASSMDEMAREAKLSARDEAAILAYLQEAN